MTHGPILGPDLVVGEPWFRLGFFFPLHLYCKWYKRIHCWQRRWTAACRPANPEVVHIYYGKRDLNIFRQMSSWQCVIWTLPERKPWLGCGFGRGVTVLWPVCGPYLANRSRPAKCHHSIPYVGQMKVSNVPSVGWMWSRNIVLCNAANECDAKLLYNVHDGLKLQTNTGERCQTSTKVIRSRWLFFSI